MALQETPFGLTKVYVDYLPKSNIGLQDELEGFMDCGKIIKLLKKSGKTNGYVVFKKPNSVRLALRRDGADFKGKKLRVEVPRGITGDGKKKKDDKAKVGRGIRVNPELQVYLSHLAKPVNEEIIRNIVAETTPDLELERVKMMAGNRNSCFITMQSKADVATFCAAYNGYPLLGMQLVAIPAQAPGVMKTGNPSTSAYDAEHDATKQQYEEEKRRNHEEQQQQEQEELQKKINNPQVGTCQKVLVGVLPETARTQDVKTIFSSCGRVTQVHFFRNKVTGAPTGVACVKFDMPRSAGKALALDGTTVSLGRDVQISVELDDNKDHVKEDVAEPVVEVKKVPTFRRMTWLSDEAPQKAKPAAKKERNPMGTTPGTVDSRKKILKKTVKVGDDEDEVILSDSEEETPKFEGHGKKRKLTEAKITPVRKNNKLIEVVETEVEAKKVKKLKKKKIVKPAEEEDNENDDMVEVSATKKTKKKKVVKKAGKEEENDDDDDDAMVEVSASKGKPSGVFDSVDLDVSDDEQFLKNNPKLAAMRQKFLKEDGEELEKPKKRRVIKKRK